MDNWLTGSSIANIAPHIFEQVPKQKRNMHTVSKALLDNQWTQDSRGGVVTVSILAGLLRLADILEEVQLTPGVQDEHSWRLAESDQYSSKSLAYNSFSIGAIHLQTWQVIWKT
ncbi:hypothetical protein PR202_gb17122 [Eleusine coracana subsp. coracana]|uniref:Uncharacterized protein n=1 Tax=Eleusine coracana subsp. coracana TaxID=191504 RepID=A0AAV5EZT1_ELECO|nr:hypothetical protein PR202_gb17122 [Eleusine coracana subsp. coracana]